MRNIKIKKTTLGIFLLCITIVVISQFILLKPIIDFAIFTADDWGFLYSFRSLTALDPFTKFAHLWIKIGIHEAAYAAYVGILGEIFGDNYSAYQYFTITLKIIATLTILPLVLVLFKNKLLAFLTTIIFAINSASLGSFYWHMKGGIFLGIILMNLFFISYYYTLLKNSKILLLLSAVLIILSYLSQPTRIFPIFFMVIIIEAYWLLAHKSRQMLKNSTVRIASFLLPFILVSIVAPISPQGRVASTPGTLLNQILEGNWFNLLSPLGGIGFSLFTFEAFMPIFGQIQISTFTSFGNYLTFLFGRSMWIFLLVLIFIGFILARRPLKFIVTAFSINIFLDILLFILATHHFSIPAIQHVDSALFTSLFFTTKYASWVAIFILSVAITAFFEWLGNKKNLLLLAVFIGPLFSLVFLSLMWVTIGYLLDAYNSMHYYHQIPAIGVSLFLASILVLFYEKYSKRLWRILALVFIFLIIFNFYQANDFAIKREFLGIWSAKIKVKDQQDLHDKLLGRIGEPDQDGNMLIYFDLPQDEVNFNYYRLALLLNEGAFKHMINWRKRTKEKGGHVGYSCNIDILKSSLKFQDGKWNFFIDSECTKERKFMPPIVYSAKDKISYSLDGFYAFKIENGDFVDIKEEVLKELGF